MGVLPEVKNRLDMYKKYQRFQKYHKKTTAPGIPVWSPTTVLTQPSGA
jgi:hypothetical protein